MTFRTACLLLLGTALAPAASADPAAIAWADSDLVRAEGLPPHCDWVVVDPLAPAVAAEPVCLMPRGGGSDWAQVRIVECRTVRSSLC